jgi:pimeloyl-ACP methyl ester carboxylesterase
MTSSVPPACELPPASREWRILTCQGSLQDLPAIVLEAGGGCARDVWRIVLEHLARRTLVIAYDRAGLGGNKDCPLDASAAGVVARLAALLARTAVPAPYLRVGHSLGGLFVQYYAAKHPAATAGIVLVDSTHTDCAAAAPILRDFSPGGRLWDPFSALAREIAASGTSQILVRRHPVLRHVPVLAVTAGNLQLSSDPSSSSEELAEARAGLIQRRRDAAAQSAVGRHVLMPDADHHSILINPEHAAVLARHILEFAETFCRHAR